MCLGVPRCRIGKRHTTSVPVQEVGLLSASNLCVQLAHRTCTVVLSRPATHGSEPLKQCFAIKMDYEDHVLVFSLQIQFSETSPSAESTADSSAQPGEQPACSVRLLSTHELQACSPGRLVCSACELWEKALEHELSTAWSGSSTRMCVDVWTCICTCMTVVPNCV